MSRFPQCVLIVSTLVASWLGMQAVHELGHVLGAWWAGGEVERVVWHPLTISRTDLSVNPRPLMVAWLGPIVGVVVPLLLWGVSAVLKIPGTFLWRFFAGFCLIANGVYIGAGSFFRVGDGDDLLRHGASLWQLWLFGMVAATTGFGLWHRQGTSFGFGDARG